MSVPLVWCQAWERCWRHGTNVTRWDVVSAVRRSDLINVRGERGTALVALTLLGWLVAVPGSPGLILGHSLLPA